MDKQTVWCYANCGQEATTKWNSRDVCQECFEIETEFDRLRDKYGRYEELELWKMTEELETKLKEATNEN